MTTRSPLGDEPLLNHVTIDSRMLFDQVSEHLFRELVSGRLHGGQRINETELARTLGISRNPIREAVRRLEERGLLVSVPRRGTFVRSFSRQDIEDVFSFRTVVEDFAIRQAMPRMSDQDIAELRAIVDTMLTVAQARKEMELIQQDIRFHQRICELSGNTQTLRAFNNIHAEVQISITLVEHRFESLEAAAVDHYPVVNAIATRDTETAAKALRDHIRDSWGRIAALPETINDHTFTVSSCGGNQGGSNAGCEYRRG